MENKHPTKILSWKNCIPCLADEEKGCQSKRDSDLRFGYSWFATLSQRTYSHSTIADFAASRPHSKVGAGISAQVTYM